MLTGGQIADCTAGAVLLARLPDCEVLHGDKGYDANAIRRQVEERGAMPNIPPKGEPQVEELFLALPLSKPQRHRANVLPTERLQARGDTLRPKRRELSRRHLHRCRR
jgi:hypothetical protein